MRSKTNDALETSKSVKKILSQFKEGMSKNLKGETYNSASELSLDQCIDWLDNNGI